MRQCRDSVREKRDADRDDGYSPLAGSRTRASKSHRAAIPTATPIAAPIRESSSPHVKPQQHHPEPCLRRNQLLGERHGENDGHGDR